MELFLDKLKNYLSARLYYHRLDVKLSFSSDLSFNSWIGSYIRNNLFYAASKVIVNNEISLFSIIETITIENTHFYYQELSGGFPKGMSIILPFNKEDNIDRLTLSGNEIFLFSICLFGDMAKYYRYFIEAVRIMCERGFGSPVVSLQLIDIYEYHPQHTPSLLTMGMEQEVKPLRNPILLDDFFVNAHNVNSNNKNIHISFETPVSLIKHKPKKNSSASYQNKQNGFPSFYQLARSVMHRLLKLTALYTDGDGTFFSRENMEKLEECLEGATAPLLMSADITYKKIRSTPKKESDGRIKFEGYMGEMTYYGDWRTWLPYLQFLQEMGVGNDVVYGLGQYRIKTE